MKLQNNRQIKYFGSKVLRIFCTQNLYLLSSPLSKRFAVFQKKNSPQNIELRSKKSLSIISVFLNYFCQYIQHKLSEFQFWCTNLQKDKGFQREAFLIFQTNHSFQKQSGIFLLQVGNKYTIYFTLQQFNSQKLYSPIS